MQFSAIQIDGKSITDRGSLVLPVGSNSVNFMTGAVEIVLEFRDGSGEPSLFSRLEGTSRAVFVLEGFTNPLGTSVVMSEVVQTAGVSYDLHVMVHAIGDPSAITRLISYSVVEKALVDQ